MEDIGIVAWTDEWSGTGDRIEIDPLLVPARARMTGHSNSQATVVRSRAVTADEESFAYITSPV
jgi:hypothetical protein